MLFTNYSNLPVELRHHILSFNDKKALRKYSTCTRYCNSEVQTFRVDAPRCFRIREGRRGVRLIVAYENRRWNIWRFKDRMDGRYDLRVAAGKEGRRTREGTEIIMSGKAIEAAFKTLEDIFKYVRNDVRKPCRIEIRHWSKELMKMKMTRHVKQFDIKLYCWSYDDFISDMNDNPSTRHANFRMMKSSKERFLLPKDFFESPFYVQSRYVNIDFGVQYLDSQFICDNSTDKSYESSTISDRAINRRIRMWINRQSHVIRSFTILKPYLSIVMFDEKVILSNVKHEKTHPTHYTVTRRDGGRATISIRRGAVRFNCI